LRDHAEPASVLLSKNDARSHRGTICLILVGAIGLNSIYHFIRWWAGTTSPMARRAYCPPPALGERRHRGLVP